MDRPLIETISTGHELKKWYWLKQELVAYAKEAKISYTGSKFEILERIADVLDGKQISMVKSKRSTSEFNWKTEVLASETIITDSYTNGTNSREFFQKHCGKAFKFNISFMKWMKENTGRTLKDAVLEWKKQQEEIKTTGKKSKIPSGNQYNQYIRDFFDDNPGKTIEDARHFWKLKRRLPLGRHKYERSDLNLKAD